MGGVTWVGPAMACATFFFQGCFLLVFCSVVCRRLPLTHLTVSFRMFCVSFPSEILTTPLPFAELDHALQCLSREDPSLRVSADPDTRQASLNVLCSSIYLFICLIILHNG